MTDKQVIAIAGGTGAQGGGLARAIQNDPAGQFQARVLTRNADSDKAKALAEIGAEVVAADVDDPASLAAAFTGAHGAFCITFFWEHFSPEKELQHARSLAEAARDTGVQHVIWSTLEDTRRWVPLDDDRMPTLMDKYKVPHFDSKGEANGIFQALVPTTLLHTSFYWDNLIHFGSGPQPDAEGRLAFTLPMGDKKLPGIAAEDIGKCAYGVFKDPDTWSGQSLGIAGEHLTGSEMAAKLAAVLGKDVYYNSIEPDVFRGLGFPGAEDLGNMFQFKRDFEDDFCAARNPDVARSLNSELQTFDAWLAVHKDEIPLD